MTNQQRVARWIAALALVATLGMPQARADEGSHFLGGATQVLPDGRTVIAGSIVRPNSFGYTWAVARFNPDGSPDMSLNGTGFVTVPIFHSYEFVSHVAVQPDGKIVIGGNAADPVWAFIPYCHPAFCRVYAALVRLNADGTPDRTFNGTGKLVIAIGGYNLADDVDALVYLSRFELAADGTITVIASDGRRTARIYADGMVDASFSEYPQLDARAFVGDEAVATEAYHASLDHYFLTFKPDEIEALDAGTAIKGWTSTGRKFKVFTQPQAGRSPVCRYYIPPARGDSHFFGRDAAECESAIRATPGLVLEDASFMYVILPIDGVCPARSIPIYRVFNNRPDANHRYTVDAAVRDAMVGKGWIAEGDGPDHVAMCAPQ